jgi:hypothetical protein
VKGKKEQHMKFKFLKIKLGGKVKRFIVGLMIGVCAVGMTHASVIIVGHGEYDADVATMNANLGIPTGAVFEDFDDTTLVPGLAMAFNGNLSETTSEGFSWTSNTVAHWVGSNSANFTATFSFSENPTFVGIGLAQFGGDSGPTNHSFTVNGTTTYLLDTATFSSLILGNGRNGYLQVTDAGGISSIEFNKIRAQDGRMHFDHIAIGNMVAVPAPGAVWLLGSGLVALVSLRKKRKHSHFKLLV